MVDLLIDTASPTASERWRVKTILRLPVGLTNDTKDSGVVLVGAELREA